MTRVVVMDGEFFVLDKGAGYSEELGPDVPRFFDIEAAKRYYGNFWEPEWVVVPVDVYSTATGTDCVDVSKTLDERGERYGSFLENSILSQHIKGLMRDFGDYNALSDDQAEALDMIACKISRILTGDPNYADSWHDIAGYATLVEKRLNGDS